MLSLPFEHENSADEIQTKKIFVAHIKGKLYMVKCSIIYAP